MKKLSLALLFAGSLWGVGPVPDAASITVDAPSANTVRACWLTDIAGNSSLKFGPSGGPYTIVYLRDNEENAITHCMVAGGRAPLTTYYFVVCSSDGNENCSTELSTTTPANPSVANQLPAPAALVDVSWPAGTGNTHTATVNCRSLQTLIDSSVATNDKLVIPVALSPGCVPFLRIPSTITNLLITTDSTNRPPPGTRDDCVQWTCTTVYRSYRDMRNGSVAQVSVLTGKPSATGNVWCFGGSNLNCWPPGSRVYARADTTWLIKKAALDGNVRTITGSTTATPIVITSAGHGFLDGEVACIKGTLGMVEARGCWTVSAATTDTFALVKRDGTNSVGYNAYTGGGEVQGLVWVNEDPIVDSDVVLDGVACPSGAADAGSWGRGRTVPGMGNADQQQYMCGTDGVWYKVDNDNTQVSDSNGAFQLAAFNLAPGGSRIRFEGINIADPPVPIMEEQKYGPLNSAPGFRTGGVFYGGKGSDRVDFNQTANTTDMAFQRPTYTTGDILFAGQTSNFVIRNSTNACGGVGIAYIDPESLCSVVGINDSPGPVGYWNNTCTAGGWCVFYAESYQMNVSYDWTVLGNTIAGNCEYSYGSPTYTYAHGLYAPLRNWYRQLLEWKTGTRIRVDGNTLDCLPISLSGIPATMEMGSQSGQIGISAISVAGAVTLNAQFPTPAMSANDRVMLYSMTGGSVTALIARVDTVSPLVLKTLAGGAWSAGAFTSAVMCQIDLPWAVRDIAITNNYYTRTAAAWNAFGMSYQGANICMSGPAGPVLVANNLAYTQSIPQAAPALSSTTTNNTSQWLSGLVDYTTIRNNTSINVDSGSSTSQIGMASTYSPQYFLNYGLLVFKNLIGSQDYGVLGEGNAGTTALNQRWLQGWTFTGNAFVRSGGAIAGEPSGNTFPTAATVDYTAAGVPKYTSAYLAYGIDQAALSRARGLITNPRVRVTTTQVLVNFTGPVPGTNYTVQSSTDGGTTWASVTSTGTGYEQLGTIAATANTVYRLRILAPHGPIDLGSYITP